MSDSLALVYLSNILPAFAYPVGSTIAILALSSLMLALGYRRCSLATILVALIWLWVTSTPFVAERMVSGLEMRFPPVELSRTPAAEVAIVLGGGIAEPAAPRVELELINESTRLLQAARLYRMGKVKKILLVGGNLPWNTYPVSEAELMHQLLIEWGVPSNDIRVAGQSRNTYENALEAIQLRDTTKFDSALLITSATHMPRAMAVFQHAGIPVTASTVHITVVNHPHSILDWVPNVKALSMTTAAMKEWIGLLVYRLRGRL
jgi:uncharacterized SAM-binding protein YcdF (DUF218 family)